MEHYKRNFKKYYCANSFSSRYTVAAVLVSLEILVAARVVRLEFPAGVDGADPSASFAAVRSISRQSWSNSSSSSVFILMS